MKHFVPPDTLSYWERTSFFHPPDVAIIGSGIVGVTAALHLKEQNPNLQVAVLERGTLPFGASTRNAGFACFGSMTELLEDLQRQPEDAVWALVERRWRGLQALRERVGDAALGYEPLGGYELFRAEEAAMYQHCLENIELFNEKIAEITGRANAYQVASAAVSDFGFSNVKYLIVNRLEGQLHTGKMMSALLRLAAERGIRFFNGMEITALESAADDVELQTTAGWTLRAARVLVTTNGFAKQLLPDLDMQPARNQVLITKPIPDLRVRGAFHYQQGYFYFRNVEDRILLGGGRHLAKAAETKAEFGTTELIRSNLEKLLTEVILPDQPYEIDNWWSGVLGVGISKTPILREVQPHVFAAVRLGGMGIAIGSLVGEQAAEMVRHS